jgi:hypothetical protein
VFVDDGGEGGVGLGEVGEVAGSFAWDGLAVQY